MLLTTVTYVERRKDVLFVGTDAGFNLAMEPVFYELPCEPAPCRLADDVPWKQVAIAGNINEAQDVWAREVELPQLQEGDHLALLNAGGYASSMASNHCMRGRADEVVLIE